MKGSAKVKKEMSLKSFEDLESWKLWMDMRAKLFVMVIWLVAKIEKC